MTGLTRPSRSPAAVINCNHHHPVCTHSFHPSFIPSATSHSVHSAVIINHHQPVRSHFPSLWHPSLSFFFFFFFLTRPSVHPSQRSCHLTDPLFTPPRPPLHPPFTTVPVPLALSFSLPLSLSLGSHVTSLKLSPINQQYLGGSVSIQLSDWLLHSDAHTHTHTHTHTQSRPPVLFFQEQM